MAGESTKIITDFSQTISGLNQLDAALANTQKGFSSVSEAAKKTSQDTAKAFQPAVVSAEQAAAASNEYAAAMKEAEAATKKTGSEVGGFSGKIKDSILNTTVFGKSIGEWKDQLSGAISNLSGAASGSGLLSGALKGIGAAIKISGIGLLVGVVESLIQYFTRFQSGVDKVAQVTAAANAVVGVLIDRFLKAGSAILNFTIGIGKFLTLDPAGAMESFGLAADDAAASVDGLATAISSAASAASQLEKDKQALRDFVSILEKRTAQREADAAASRRVFEDERRSNGARLAALAEEGRAKKAIAEDELTAAKERQRIALRDLNLNAVSRDDAEKKKEAQAAAIEVIKAGGKVQAAIFDNEKEQREFRKKAADERQKALKKELEDLEKLKRDIETLRVASQDQGIDADLAAVNKKYDDLIRVSDEGIKKLTDIEKRRALTPAELAQRQEFGDLAVKIEEKRLSALVGVLEGFNEKELALEKEQLDKRKALTEKELNAQNDLRVQQLKQGEAAADAFLLRLKAQGATEAEIAKAKGEFDLLIQQASLRQAIEYQESILSVTDKTDTLRIEQVKESIKTLKAQLGNIDFKIDNPDKPKTSIFSLLGLDPNDPNFERDKEALQKAAAQAVSSIQAIGQARLDAAQAAVEAADQEVQAAENKTQKAQEALDRELELSKQGFASNVSLKLDELAAAQKAEEEKKRLREKALQDQAKAQKTQIILDGVLQASNLVTASTDIIKGFAKIPIVGGVLGIAAVGLMLAAFIKQKAAALQAVSAQKFRHGGSGWLSDSGYVDGRTHEQGGHLLEVEHGEIAQVGEDGGRKRLSVVRRERVRDYFDLLDAANRNDKRAIIHHALSLAGGAAPDYSTKFNTTDNDIHIDRESVSKRVFGSGKTDHVTMSTNDGSADAKRTNQLLEMMLKQMMKGDSKETWSADGKTRTRGNVRTTYLN